MRLTELIDCFLYATATAVIVAVLVSAARAGELPVDQSQNARIQAIEDALQDQLSAYDDKLNAIESRQDDLEARLSKLESAAKPSAVIAETIQKAATPAPVTSNRYTRSELDAWVRARYTPSTPLRSGVMARGYENQVWNHLVQHGFTSAQVTGLEYWVASALHDARHGGRISPFRSTSATTVVAAATVQPAKPTPAVTVQKSYSYNCANGNCSRQMSYAYQGRPVRRVLRLFR